MTQVTDHLNHSTWECKYHVVFTPKHRKKALFGPIRKELKDVFHRLAAQKNCKIEEGHLMPDHVHMLISIPPEACGGKRCGVLERQELDLGGTEYSRQEAKFRWPQVLGQRQLCLNRRSRRESDPRLYPQSGK